ncbi:MAG: hypothetical protein EOP47_05165 [Sphingobacteriaceae bacterium]|nr:MAG: hypothetical protein EOP47_05165 [Sphingobacteriaceae bacterium]
MVRVTTYAVRQSKDGRDFITLEITGGLELILSPATGRHYATIRKCSIPSTFDELTAQSLIGMQLPGEIVKVPCEQYEYLKKSTNEIMILDYNYAYQATTESDIVGHTQVQDLQVA